MLKTLDNLTALFVEFLELVGKVAFDGMQIGANWHQLVQGITGSFDEYSYTYSFAAFEKSHRS
jgi:hypothetical protein